MAMAQCTAWLLHLREFCRSPVYSHCLTIHFCTRELRSIFPLLRIAFPLLVAPFPRHRRPWHLLVVPCVLHCIEFHSRDRRDISSLYHIHRNMPSHSSSASRCSSHPRVSASFLVSAVSIKPPLALWESSQQSVFRYTPDTLSLRSPIRSMSGMEFLTIQRPHALTYSSVSVHLLLSFVLTPLTFFFSPAMIRL